MDHLEEQAFLAKRRTLVLGRNHHFYDSLGSTNKVLIEKHASEGEGTVVASVIQESGRGRLERVWTSPEGGLWFSVLLDPGAGRMTLIPLIAGISVALSLKELGIESGIKWPNDVLINGKKVCGILVEGGKAGAAVGIGVNCNFRLKELPDELQETATTLLDETGTYVRLTDLLVAILEEMDELYKSYKAGDYESILQAWKDNAITLGKIVRADTPGGQIVGKAVDIDHDGALVLEKDGKRFTVLAGDCIHLR